MTGLIKFVPSTNGSKWPTNYIRLLEILSTLLQEISLFFNLYGITIRCIFVQENRFLLKAAEKLENVIRDVCHETRAKLEGVLFLDNLSYRNSLMIFFV